MTAAMTNPSRAGKRSLQLDMPAEERERITNAAMTRDMNDSTFVRMVVAGALARGGGTVESLLAAGEKSVKVRAIRRTGKVDPLTFWTKVGPGTYEWGVWSLIKMAAPNDSRGKDDQSKWWHLTHRDRHDLMIPMAFQREEAMRTAYEMIDGGAV